MVRYRERITMKPDDNKINLAIEFVREGYSVRGAAKRFGIPLQTLRQRLKGCKTKSEAHMAQRVFNCEQEQQLEEYLLKSAKLFYGLSIHQLRTLAFQFAQRLKAAKSIKKIPASWFPKNDEKPAASRDWTEGFMKRHPKLTLRCPVSTSLGRAIAFNAHIVQEFFDLYEKIRQSHQYTAATVWNMDETGLNTVHKTKYVIAQKGQRCVSAISSGERGTNVTLTMAVSAAGEKIPPFFVFPRVNMKDKFLLHSNEDAKGVANGSGWQTANTFCKFLLHFKQHAIKASTKRTLLILDNHESHMTIEALEFCKQNNIDLLTLPPHTSHKLQPLDRGVFGPLKSYYANQCNAWMFNHPSVPIAIENVAELATEPILKGASSVNIISGFRATGIWPFNRNIFTEDDFLASTVTDRPYENVDKASLSHPMSPTLPLEPVIQEPSISNPMSPLNQEPMQVDVNQISVEVIRPLPKAEARKESNRGRKRRKAAILIDPEMIETIRVEQEEVAKKKDALSVKKKLAAERKFDKELLKRQKAAEKTNKEAIIKIEPKRKRGRPCVAKVPKDEEDDEVILKYQTKRRR
ncbi:tigger transposable element-derived protein 1-like [Leptopilina heterotoma]|uniref:tigger transposable element-derived protein 1-like n=1 Tax=Leptopilina heterotoma TaxID=63436 RepID=UPI001CA9A3B6|nr:tigger transposable element-derived protein 1-like [Leptopilina heterotoma]